MSALCECGHRAAQHRWGRHGSCLWECGCTKFVAVAVSSLLRTQPEAAPKDCSCDAVVLDSGRCERCGAMVVDAPLTHARVAGLVAVAGEALEVIEDCWNQFAYDRGGVKSNGGLSTLEWVEEFLPKFRAALEIVSDSRDGADRPSAHAVGGCASSGTATPVGFDPQPSRDCSSEARSSRAGGS